MLGVVFAVAVIAAITAHHFLIERPRERAVSAGAEPAPRPLSGTMGQLPKGVFFQPTYTWSEIRPSGDLLVGLHPMLLGLVGPPYELELLAQAGRVRKGEPLFRLGSGGRWLTIDSPVTGKILETKKVIDGKERRQPSSSWLCRIEPERVAEEVPGWMVAEKAVEWTQRKFGQIRDHLMAAGAERELGVTLADGGEIPVGILAEFDEAEWQAFEDAFLRS